MMITGFVYEIRKPKSLQRHYTCDEEHAELMHSQGYQLFARRFSFVGEP